MYLRHLCFYLVSLYNNPLVVPGRFTLLRALQTITTGRREICLGKSKRFKPLRISSQDLPDLPGFAIGPVSTYFLIDFKIPMAIHLCLNIRDDGKFEIRLSRVWKLALGDALGMKMTTQA